MDNAYKFVLFLKLKYLKKKLYFILQDTFRKKNHLNDFSCLKCLERLKYDHFCSLTFEIIILLNSLFLLTKILFFILVHLTS
jgi:hypothetical protein